VVVSHQYYKKKKKEKKKMYSNIGFCFHLVEETDGQRQMDSQPKHHCTGKQDTKIRLHFAKEKKVCVHSSLKHN
jgi:hypothetical protein